LPAADGELRGDLEDVRSRGVAAGLQPEVGAQVLATRPQTQPAVELHLDEIVVGDVEDRRLVSRSGDADLKAVLDGNQVFRQACVFEERLATFARFALTADTDLWHGRPPLTERQKWTATIS